MNLPTPPDCLTPSEWCLAIFAVAVGFATIALNVVLMP